MYRNTTRGIILISYMLSSYHLLKFKFVADKHQPFSTEEYSRKRIIFQSEFVKIRLCSKFLIPLIIIIPVLCVHIVHKTNRKKVKVTNAYAKLYASEQE